MGAGKANFFNFYLEVFSYTIVGQCAVIGAFAFGLRCIKINWMPLNISGLLASLVAIVYTVIGLTYWFEGLDNMPFGCSTLQKIHGSCMSASNAIVFLHLFLKAEASNKGNKQWPIFRIIGILSTLWNWATLIAVHAMVEGYTVTTPDGPRCKYDFNDTTFDQKWIAQLANQIVQTAFFCYPLITHMRRSQAIRKGNDLYEQLVGRAIASCTFAVCFTAMVTGLVFAGQKNAQLEIPNFSLAVLDNAVNLAGIYFAINVSTGQNKSGKFEPSSSSTGSGNIVKQATGSGTGSKSSGVSKSHSSGSGGVTSNISSSRVSRDISIDNIESGGEAAAAVAPPADAVI